VRVLSISGGQRRAGSILLAALLVGTASYWYVAIQRPSIPRRVLRIGLEAARRAQWMVLGMSGGPSAPKVTTTAASSITSTSARAGGNVTADGGSSVTSRGACYGFSANPTTPCTNDGHTYRTAFPSTENPISENGAWLSGSRIGGPDVQVSPGFAYGVIGPSGKDAIAILAGSWNPDQSAQATVKINNRMDMSTYQEVELHLREIYIQGLCGSYPQGCALGYEIMVGTNHDYLNIARWDAPPNFVYIAQNKSVHINDGDTVLATVSGQNPVTINVYVHGTLILTGIDSSPNRALTGAPGIGFNADQGATYADAGWSSFRAADTGTGAFTSILTGLSPGSVYHYRAFATNPVGTAYGSDLTFNTLAFRQ
jgi:hypothetical protein